MSVPVPRDPSHDDGWWETARQAIRSWPETLRLCLLLLVWAVAMGGVGVAIAELIRHLL
jgi:hypothetical protein